MPEPIISILLPCYASYELFNKVFPLSIRNIKMNKDFELILFNNGGGFEGILDHKEFQLLEKLPRKYHPNLCNVKFIGEGKNLGLNKALNECAREAKGMYFFLPHVDMFMLPNCLNTLLEAAKNQSPTSFLLCSRSIEPTKGHTEHHIIENYGKEPSEFNNDKDIPENSEANRLLKKYGENYKNSRIEVGARMPFFMHRKLWEKMKGVDENYFSYCTDDDLIQTAYHVGVRKFWMVHDSLVYHLQGKSNNQQKVDKDSNAPYLYFVDKWRKLGYSDASHPGEWHPKMIPFYTKVR